MANYEKDKLHRITIRLTEEQLKALDSFAVKKNLNRSDVIRVLLEDLTRVTTTTK